MKMYDVVALGELLIDFTPYGLSNSGMCLFEQNPGGAPANVLCALAKLGMRTGFIGKVGKDIHGTFLRQVLEENGVCTRGLLEDPAVFTTLAFVELSQTGERTFSFARKPGADTCLRQEELAKELLEQTRVFHFGSLSLTAEPSRSATLAAIREASAAGAIISYDPNYREPLWNSLEEAVRQMRSVLSLVDLVKISDEEMVLLTGEQSPERASEILLERGAACAVVTLGEKGALVRTRDGYELVPAKPVAAVDTTGAGDAFWGGFLYRMLESNESPRTMTLAQGRGFVHFANTVAGLCVRKRGAIPALPNLRDVERELR